MRNPTATTTVSSTLDSSAQVMGIDAEGMGVVLSILSNMYSDSNLAVVREYACNALDSHVEAGNPDPILVTSPSALNPRLTIEDFGVGLSKDEMLNVYAKYGASTKRGCRSKILRCNDGSCADCQRARTQIGAFGIGAKSAFTAGTQFVVTANKNGEKTVVLFALNEDGAPTVNVLSHEEADEPNGVKVDIGVRDVRGVVAAINKLFFTWKPGTVLVDGVEPVSLWSSAEELIPSGYQGNFGVHLTKRQDRYDDPAFMVVMGGVAYALPDSVIGKLSSRNAMIVRNVMNSYAKVVFTVGIGDVDITPSREELRDTNKTLETVSHCVTNFYNAMPKYINARFDAAKTMLEAMILRRELEGQFSYVADLVRSATWRGQKIKNTKIETSFVQFVLHRRGYYGEYTATRIPDTVLMPGMSLERWLFVVNTPERRVRSVQLAAKPYLRDQLNQSSASPNYINTVVAVHGDSFSDDWFDTNDESIHTVEYDDFVAEWKPKVGAGSGQRKPVTYTVEGAKGYENVSVADLTELDDVVYLTHYQARQLHSASEFMESVCKSHTLVLLGARQKEDVFLKRVPHATPARPVIEQEARKVLLSLTQTDLDTLAAGYFLTLDEHYYLTNFLERHRNKITNPVVLQMLQQRKDAKQLQAQNNSRVAALQRAASFLSTTIDFSTSTVDTELFSRVSKGLPILKELTRWGTHYSEGDAFDHIIEYINRTTIS